MNTEHGSKDTTKLSLSAWLKQQSTCSPGDASQPPRIVIASFSGWNDAGEVAVNTCDELINQLNAEFIETIHQSNYYDYQVIRPTVEHDETGVPRISWPGTDIYHVAVDQMAEEPPALDIIVMQGIEPSTMWPQYCEEFMDWCWTYDVDAVVILGAYLADVPHSRPLRAELFTTNDVAAVLEFPAHTASFAGRAGIVSVLSAALSNADIPFFNSWVAVPHYVAQSPSPKAQLGMVAQLEELLELKLDLSALSDTAAAWERGVNELAEQDSDIAEYVKQLEEAQDTENHPDATGDAIARDFERYLQRRDDDSRH